METLVAISILSLALSGILSLFSMGVRSSVGASNQIKAFFLASEGIEFLRNKRDSNIISGAIWSDGFDGCEDGCYADVYAEDSGITSCSGACPKLRFNSELNRYDYGAGSAETVFTRRIVSERVNDRELKISSEIFWPQGGIERSFSLVEHLFDLSF